MKNKKGNKGFIIDIWNGQLSGNSETPRGGKLQVKIRPVEVKSCGKVQMTLEYLQDGKMTQTFHKPEREIYINKEDAEEASKSIHAKWLSNSISHTKRVLVNHGECYNKYAWWPKQKTNYKNFIKALTDNQIELSIVY